MKLLLDFGGTDLKVALSEDGRIINSGSVPAAELHGDLDAAPALISQVLGTLPVLQAVGIALPGVVNPKTGELLHANDKYDFVKGIDLRAWGERAFGAPCVVENDARAALIGEVADLSGNDNFGGGDPDTVLITLGTGIGTGAYQDGHPLRGSTGHAGILGGHCTVDMDGQLCPCGNIGCAETRASTWLLNQGDRFPGGYKQVFDQADAGDPEALQMVEESVRTWGTVAVNMCHQYDPQVLILTGGAIRGTTQVESGIREFLDRHLWPSIKPPAIVVPEHPELSVLKGLDVMTNEITGEKRSTR